MPRHNNTPRILRRKPMHTVLLLAGIIFTALILVYMAFFRLYGGSVSLKKPGAQQVPACKHCNVIVISVDTLSALHLPCYGYRHNTAPNLCAFAKNHTLFTNAYSQSYFTLPSHFSMLTGQYPSVHGMLETGKNTLRPSSETLASALKQNGYKTYYYGPTDSDQLPVTRGIERGFDVLADGYAYDKASGLTHWKNALEMLGENRKLGVPTFLFLHTYYVHEPYLTETRNLHFGDATVSGIPVTEKEYFSFPPGYITFVKNYLRQNPPNDPDSDQEFRQFMATESYSLARTRYEKLTEANCSVYCLMNEYYYAHADGDPKSVSYMKALYDELILQFDARFKEILDALGPMVSNDTIVVITADHGEGFMEHGSLFHRSLYDEILRVPVVIAMPHDRPQRIGTPVQSIDIMPTVLGLLGLPVPSSVNGENLSSLTLGTTFLFRHAPIISERFDMVPGYRRLVPITERTIVSGGWKLYLKEDRNHEQSAELYDTKNDPWDTANVASLHPFIVTGLRYALNQFAAAHRVMFPQPDDATPTPVPSDQQRYFHY